MAETGRNPAPLPRIGLTLIGILIVAAALCLPRLGYTEAVISLTSANCRLRHDTKAPQAVSRLGVQSVENLPAEPIQRFSIVRIRDPDIVQLQCSDRENSFSDVGRSSLVDATTGPVMKG